MKKMATFSIPFWSNGVLEKGEKLQFWGYKSNFYIYNKFRQ